MTYVEIHQQTENTREGWKPGYGDTSDPYTAHYIACTCGWEGGEKGGWRDKDDRIDYLMHVIESLNKDLAELAHETAPSRLRF